MAVEKLQYFVNGQFKDSKTDTWYDLHNPSTGEVTGQAPCCTNDEVLEAIAAAKAARCHDFIMGLDHGYDTIVGGASRPRGSGNQARTDSLQNPRFDYGKHGRTHHERRERKR